MALGHSLPLTDKYVWTTYYAPGFFSRPWDTGITKTHILALRGDSKEIKSETQHVRRQTGRAIRSGALGICQWDGEDVALRCSFRFNGQGRSHGSNDG